MSVANKNILLLGIGFYDYEKAILDTLSKCFANAYYASLRYQSLVGRILAHICPPLLKRIESDFVTKQIQDSPKDIDYIIIIKGEHLTDKHIALLKQKYPSAKILLYLWDSLVRISNSALLLRSFNNIYTFDRLDAIKYGLKFRPLFYRKSYPHNEKCLYDISFIGWMHSERYQLLHLLKKQFQRHGISYKFVLYTSRYSYFINRYVKGAIKKEDSDFFVFKPISYEDYIKISYASKVILDLAHPLQSGLTMRTIEAIGMKKKILTNNADILNYSSLNSNNYFVFEKPNLFIDYSLFSNKYVETNNSYFSLESFVNELVQNLER